MNNTIPTDDSVVEHDGIDYALFWHVHKKKILLGLLAVVVLGGGSLVWLITSTLTNNAAVTALASASDISQYEALVKNYQGTMSAADAMLLLASANRDAGKMEESTAAFQNFLKSYPKHPLAGGALLGVGQNQDAMGNSAEAAATYQQVYEKYPQSYAAPFAAYAQAEILLRDFRREEARVVLESLVSQFPNSPVIRLAAARMARLGPKGEISK